MRKAISILIAMSLVIATLWLSSSESSAQKAGKGPDKDKDPVAKAMEKNWDRLPEQAKRVKDPKFKEAWNKLTPKQHQMLTAKVQQIIGDETVKYQKDKAAKLAKLKTWDDVTKSEGPNSGEDETLTFTDAAGKSRSVKAKRRDGSIKPGKEVAKGSAGIRSGPTAPTRAQQQKVPWQGDWAAMNSVPANTKPKSHHAGRGSTNTLAPLPPQAGCSMGPDQFVRAFYQGVPSDPNYGGAFARPPSASELSYWMVTIGQAQSQGTFLSVAQNLGYTFFQSSEYASRGRSNHDFVLDCYAAFLHRYPDQGGWDFWTTQADAYGQGAVLPGFANSIEFQNDVNAVCNVATFDGDYDQLPDNFENSVADNFTPEYHVSYFEPDNYSTFQDSVPLAIKQVIGPTPVSHFRVTPVTITTNPHNGQLESFLRIDYLTLWDHDSGLVGGGCIFSGLPFLAGMNGHPLDGERSAQLVSAPAPNSYTYNTDPNAYHSLSTYTAAHENTAGDQSMYHDYPTTPMSAGWHIPLWQALQKHSTYTFDPDFWPIITIELQIIIWTVIEIIFYFACNQWYEGDSFWEEFFGDFGDFGNSFSRCQWIWLFVTYEVFTILYVCAVERFNSFGTGGMVSQAPIRINVGEPAYPINASSFIQDNAEAAFHLRDKLLTPLRFESQIP